MDLFDLTSPAAVLRVSFASWGEQMDSNGLLATYCTTVLAWEQAWLQCMPEEWLRWPHSKELLFHSPVPRWPTIIITIHLPPPGQRSQKKNWLSRFFLQFSCVQCKGQPGRKCWTWAVSLFSFVLSFVHNKSWDWKNFGKLHLLEIDSDVQIGINGGRRPLVRC